MHWSWLYGEGMELLPLQVSENKSNGCMADPKLEWKTGIADVWRQAIPYRIFLPCFLLLLCFLDLSMLEVLLACCPTVKSLQTNLSVQSCLHLVEL